MFGGRICGARGGGRRRTGGRGRVECRSLLLVVCDVEVSFGIFIVSVCGAERRL